MASQDYGLARRMWHQLEPIHAMFWYAPEVFAEAAARDRLAARGWVDAAGRATGLGRDGRDEIEWRTDRLADAPWQVLGSGAAQRLAELTGPVLGAVFESGLLPGQSTLGITNVSPPAPRP